MNENSDEGGFGAESGPKKGKKGETAGTVVQPSKVIDLEAISFHKGCNTMTNKECLLPQNSSRVDGPSWEEICIPAPDAPDLTRGDLVPISELPKWAHGAFPPSIKQLNPIQSKVYPTAFNSYNDNMLICAPTGAGKTNIAMLSILNVMAQHINPETGKLDLNGFKVVYIAPMKALVQEVQRCYN
jgi:pre-mRNA-splicing helicase BRR2